MLDMAITKKTIQANIMHIILGYFFVRMASHTWPCQATEGKLASERGDWNRLSQRRTSRTDGRSDPGPSPRCKITMKA